MILLAAALAIGPEVWGSMGSGRLYEAADGDSATAISAYEALINDLTEEDPRRAELLYWLGRARFSEGDLVGARANLSAAAAAPMRHPGAREWLARMDLIALALPSLPYVEDFLGGTGHFVRGWPMGEPSDLSVGPPPEEPDGTALIWHLEVAEGESDFLLLPLGAKASNPAHLALRLRAGAFDLRLQPVWVEPSGRRWRGPPLLATSGRWTPVSLGWSDFSPESGGAPRPGRLAILRLEDITALSGPHRGDNELYVDDVEVR